MLALTDRLLAEDLSAWTRDVSVLFGTTQDEARFFHRPTGLYSRPDVDPADVYTPETPAAMAGVLAGDRTVFAHHHFARVSPAARTAPPGRRAPAKPRGTR